jgi:hypothetical protein
VAVWTVAVSVWVAVATVDEIRHGDDGDPAAGGEVSVQGLRTGDCFDLPEGREVHSVTTVPCDEHHDAEVYSTFDLPEGEYPGDHDLAADTLDACTAEFDEFVGTAYQDSVLDVAYFFPTASLWRLGDRGVSCSVFEPTRPPSDEVNRITGTLRNARR